MLNSRLRLHIIDGRPCWRQVLRSLPLLQQLTLHGCPVTKREDYPEVILQELPLVEQLDGRRVSVSPGETALSAFGRSLC